MNDNRLGESSSTIQNRVEKARQIQRNRFNGSEIACNSEMRPGEIRKHCDLDDTGRHLMKAATTQMQLSARSYHRILKLARTIADLAGSESITPVHLAEAIQYRPRMNEG
jgi:magnesium chelatase family protein